MNHICAGIKTIFFSLAISISSVATAAYPDKPIKIVVPYGAGGAADLLARNTARKLQDVLQQPVIVENKPGGNTSIGVRSVLNAPADGYTILLGSTASLALNDQVYKKPLYNPNELRTVGLIGSMISVMAINPAKISANTPTEFAKMAKASQTGFNYGITGVGTPTNLASLLYIKASGISMVSVPYPSSSTAINALLSGDIQVNFETVNAMLPFIQSGRAKILAVGAESRVKSLPDVPTMVEAGFPNVLAASWWAFSVSEKVPEEIVNVLNRAMNKIVQEQEFSSQLESQGFVPFPPNSTAQIAGFIRGERDRWGAIIRENGISLDQ